MHTFKLWAPLAKHAKVIVNGRELPLRAKKHGWWTAKVESAGAGDDYLFSVDEQEPRPDPRSAWQPNGVHEASRIVDHAAFDWSDDRFQARPLSHAIVYELHVGTFTPQGTFEAIIEHLNHLVQLGITHVELMPVAEFPGERGWGYDGSALYAVREAYGGPTGLKRLVDACHAHGLAVILDVVYNHLGPSGNYLAQFGPYFSERHSTPWGWALNFDGPYSDGVRRFFCDNAIMWLRDYHFDGLRLDAVHAIVDTSAIPFLEQLATEVNELKAHLGRHLVLIAESDLNDPRVVRPWEIGGFGLDAQWSDDFHHALHSVLADETDGYYCDFGQLSQLAGSLQQPFVYAGDHSSFRKRRHGRAAIGTSGHSFLGYLQNHDQLGNRARGDRLTSLVNLDRAKIGAALVLTSPFVPMLFQGEEWGASSPFQYFVDFSEDPALAQSITEGRRREFAAFGWEPECVPDPQSPETFARSKLDWDEIQHGNHAELLAWHRSLIALRRRWPCLTDGRLDLVTAVCDETDRWLTVERGLLTIVCNFADQDQQVPVAHCRNRQLLLTSKAVCATRRASVVLPAESVAIFGPRVPRKSRRLTMSEALIAASGAVGLDS